MFKESTKKNSLETTTMASSLSTIEASNDGNEASAINSIPVEQSQMPVKSKLA